MNYAGFRILEQCDGTNNVENIVKGFAEEFKKEEKEAKIYVSRFLEKMTGHGMIAWRNVSLPAPSECKPPETVFWDITAKCNLRCEHCYQPERDTKKQELSTDQAKRLIEELSAFEVSSVVISGGEPLLRRDALEIMQFATSFAFADVSLATNGILINRETAAKLKKTRVSVQVSVDGDTAALHDSIRGVKGSFDSALRGIKLLMEAGVPTSTSTVATKKNVEHIPRIIELMRNLHVDSYRVQGMMPVGCGRSNKSRLRLTPARMKQLVKYLKSQSIKVSSYDFTLAEPPSVPVDLDGEGTCAAATSSCSITPSGNVVPCAHFWGLRSENVRDHSFRWIWENSPILRYFRSICLNEVKGKCRECRWLMICHGGCKAENFLTGDILGRIPLAGCKRSASKSTKKVINTVENLY